MEKTNAITVLSALAHETRLEIFRFLIQEGIEGSPAGRIAARLSLPATTLSFHLNALKQARLVTSRRQSRSIIYTADFKTMNNIMAYLIDNCCHGTAEETCSEPTALEAARVRKGSG
ncbi:MAG: ArsR/SmtB family transcription factor [Acidiferrobacterales bacterium]